MQQGRIVIVLGDYLKQNNISKYKIIKNCDMSATQLNNYCNNKVSRVDLPVLERIIGYLNCNIEDVLKFIHE